MQKVTPFLWFDKNLEEALNFYSLVFKGTQIKSVKKFPPGQGFDGKIMGAEFNILGQDFKAMEAGPTFKFTEAISMMVDCDTQEEVDYYWDKLSGSGGEESQCGWLKDKFGLSWQIIPKRLTELMADKDPARAQRAMQAMLKMKKINITELEQAADAK